MKNNNLKYLIAGTGGVGGSIAAFLALAGKDVTCIARGGHLAALRENGLKLHSDLKGEHTLDVPAYTAEEYGKYCISVKYFDGVTPAGDSGLLLPVPTEETYYKIVVDLKDGFTIDKENLDGNYYTIVPANGKKFTVTFTPTTL
mgnify:CR=1 FL=1